MILLNCSTSDFFYTTSLVQCSLIVKKILIQYMLIIFCYLEEYPYKENERNSINLDKFFFITCVISMKIH